MQISHRPTMRMELPLVVLAAGAVLAGFVELPPWLGNRPLFSGLLGPLLPEAGSVRGGPGSELLLAVVSAVVALGGVYLAYLFFLRRPELTANLTRRPAVNALRRFWLTGWGFDWLYNHLFVWPVVWLARANKDDVIDSLYDGVAGLFRALNRGLSRSQTGRVRWYALGIALGAVILIGIAMLLRS
jgi:NADH-quinone oxidoreductase subunit L